MGQRWGYKPEDQELFLIGISHGVGTCSDLKEVDVAVFLEKPPDQDAPPWWQDKRVRLPLACQGAVLREPNRSRVEIDPNIAKELLPFAMRVRRLKYGMTIENALYFAGNDGWSRLYLPS